METLKACGHVFRKNGPKQDTLLLLHCRMQLCAHDRTGGGKQNWVLHLQSGVGQHQQVDICRAEPATDRGLLRAGT